MSDQFSSFPAPPRGPASYPSGRQESVIRIQSLPDGLKQSAATNRPEQVTKVTGEITSSRADGRVTIRTPSGDIEGQVRNPKSYREGQRVEIVISRREQAAKAVIRSQTQQQQTQEQSAGTERRPAEEATQPPRPQPSAQDAPRQALSPSAETPRPPPPNTPQRSLTPYLSPTQTGSGPSAETAQQPLSSSAFKAYSRGLPAQASLPPLNTGLPVTLSPLPQGALDSYRQPISIKTETVRLAVQLQQRFPLLSDLASSHATSQNGPLTTSQSSSQTLASALPLLSAVPEGSPIRIQQSPVTPRATLQTSPTHMTATEQMLIALNTGSLAFITNTQGIAQAQANLTQSAFATSGGELTAFFARSGTSPSQTFIPFLPNHANAQPLINTNMSAGQVQAEIIGRTHNGLPVIQVESGAPTQTTHTSNTLQAPTNATSGTPSAARLFFVFQHPASGLVTGDTMTLSLSQSVGQVGTQLSASSSPVAAPSATPTPTSAITPAIPLFNNFQWPALDNLFQQLQTQAPQVAQALAQALPAQSTAPQRLPPAALFFIAAIRAGDIGQWLGQKSVDAIRSRGGQSLLERVNSDMRGLQRTGAEPVSQDWRAVALPFYSDGEITKMMLFYRHDQDHGAQNDDNKKRTRFIFDLQLNRMGAVQLDGLHRGERLDLIVRAEKHFSEGMRQTMRQRYVSALEQAGISGELSFQNKNTKWVHITIDADQGEGVSV